MFEGGPAATIQRLDPTRPMRLHLAMTHMATLYPHSHQRITSLHKTPPNLVRVCNINRNSPRVFNSPHQNDPFIAILSYQRPVATSTEAGLQNRTRAGDTNLATSHPSASAFSHFLYYIHHKACIHDGCYLSAGAVVSSFCSFASSVLRYTQWLFICVAISSHSTTYKLHLE